MKECMYQQNTSPKGCYYENKDHSVIFIECDTADCYYKQLKRLEQENAELKAKVEELDKMTGIFSARLCEKYRKTLQEIKECLKDWEKAYMSFGFCEYDNILEKIKALITKSEVGE